MAFEGELILLLASHAVFVGDQFPGHTHMKIFVSVPQAIGDHRIDKLPIADAVAGSCLRQQIGAVGHGFHPPSDNYFRFAKLHRLRGESYGFQSGTADFVDGHGRNAGITAALQRRLPRRILSQPRLHHVAENGFINLLSFEASAANRFSNSFAAKFGRRKSDKTTLKFSDRCAHSGENDGSFRTHGKPPEEPCASLYRDRRKEAPAGKTLGAELSAPGGRS